MGPYEPKWASKSGRRVGAKREGGRRRMSVLVGIIVRLGGVADMLGEAGGRKTRRCRVVTLSSFVREVGSGGGCSGCVQRFLACRTEGRVRWEAGVREEGELGSLAASLTWASGCFDSREAQTRRGALRSFTNWCTSRRNDTRDVGSGWQGNDGFQTSDNPLLVRKNRSAKLSILSTSAAPFRIVQSPASHYGEGTKRVSDRSSSSILLKRRRPALRSVC